MSKFMLFESDHSVFAEAMRLRPKAKARNVLSPMFAGFLALWFVAVFGAGVLILAR